MTSLADAAADAYLAGWALTEAPYTDRVHAGCIAAMATALEHRTDPGILEAALDLGHLEGTWALVYQRREALLRKHLKAVTAAWDACMADLDPCDVVRRFRSSVYLPAESATKDPTKKWWQDTGIAAALGWLRQVYYSGGYPALLAAIEAAIRDGMAEGEAGALAVAASRQGVAGFAIGKAFGAAQDRYGNDPAAPSLAAAAVTGIIDGAGGDAGRRLAALAGEDASADDMAGGVEDVTLGSRTRAVIDGTGNAFWGAIGLGAMALYALAGVASVSWEDTGDARECLTCADNASRSPYAIGDVPPFPAHNRCRCSLSTSSLIASALLDAFLN